MDGDKDRPPGWVEFEVKETSLDEEESLKKTSNCGQTKTTTMPKIDPLSLNEIPLNDEEGGLSQSSKPDGSVAFTKTNGHASSDNQKGVAKLQMSSQNAIQSAQTILNGAKHSSTNNNHKNSEVIVGVGHTNGGSVGEPKSFKTGKVLTSVYPTNLRCAWLAPPEYDPTKMPKILSHEQIHLDPATYVDIMKCITGDIRFNSDPFIQMLIDCRDAHASGDELDYSILYDENSDNQSEDNEPPHSRYQDINKAIEYGFVSVCRK